MNERIAVFPGSFDPVTVGHEQMVLRAAEMFDKIYIAVSSNCEKKSMFNAEERIMMLKAVFEGNKKIEVEINSALTCEYAVKRGACVIIKGLRSGADFDYEYLQSESNYSFSGIETIYIPPHASVSYISSTFVRELIKYGKPFESYVPKAAAQIIRQIISSKT